MKKSAIILAFLILILGGCNVMNNSNSGSPKNQTNELPDTLAFQDEFTRDFLASSEEVEDGYYLFESQTNGFTMLFPVNARMGRAFYQWGDYKEDIEIYEHNEDENEGYNLRINYYDEESTNWTDSYLSLLSNTNGFEGEFEELEVNDNSIHYAEFIEKVNDKNNGSFFVFISYIKSNNSNKALTFSYGVRCLDESKVCHLNIDTERDKAKKLMESVKFSP
jgi:hypothetical protein